MTQDEIDQVRLDALTDKRSVVLREQGADVLLAEIRLLLIKLIDAVRARTVL